MSGIKISAAIRNAFPPGERSELEGALWDKSGGRCFLCNGDLNRATDDVECDHDLPESDGGLTELPNLNLVHRGCNRFKRGISSKSVRPYLKFKTFLNTHSHGLRYGDCLQHFDVTPKESIITIATGDEATFEFPNGTKAKAQIFNENVRSRSIRVSYVRAPIEAIFNDDAVQPRTVKPNHVYSILLDLERNPLHEAPACRVEMDSRGKAKLLMFDGQHKTIATWLTGSRAIVMKVYFDFSQQDATELVNSIQAKIKKLPLSPFELAAKLSDEWRQKLEIYEGEVGEANASEAGFISWLPQAERPRAKGACKAALTQNLLSTPELEFIAHVSRTGEVDSEGKITENVFKSKVLDTIVFHQPLEDAGERMIELRDQERKSVTRLLNLFVQQAFDNDGSPQAETRIKRIKYQVSLEYATKILRDAFMHFVAPSEPKAFLISTPTEAQWRRLGDAVTRLVEHKVWTADVSTSQMRQVEHAFSKNQGAEAAFKGVGLTLGYVVGVGS